MSREIKFRAWDEIEKKMWIPIIKPNGKLMAPGLIGGYITFDDPQDPVMQYTGLKDKNGTEIYEGDVMDKGVIEYSELGYDCGGGHHAGFYFKDYNDLEWQVNMCECEVIGNIYENPELLENDHE